MHKEVVRQKILSELIAGGIARPFDSPPFKEFRLSPLGLVPKKEQTRFYRFIICNFHQKESINDFTDKYDTSVNYVLFDDTY